MGLKILHTADWHLDAPFGNFSGAQQAYLKTEQRRLPQKIADLCRRENCDMMLLAGDIFDGQPTKETVELTKKALESAGVPVLIAPGNHDFCSAEGIWKQETWPDNVFVFTRGLESVSISGLDCRIYGAGYQSMDCPGLLDHFQADGTERYQIAVLHGDPIQTSSPYCPVTASQVRQSGLTYLALGHVHKAGAFRAGSTLCAWPGCPMGRGWDETGSKGVCIVTLEESAQVQAVSLDTPRFHDLQAEADGDGREALELLLPGAGNQDFYRVALTGSGSVSVPELLKHFSRFPNLQIIDKTDAPVDIWAEADEDSLEGIYFGMLKSAMENTPEHAEQIRLAAEISRKILTGREVIL